MKIGFYPRLAADGMRKNRRLYRPYLFTCIGMVLMTYIISYLESSDVVRALHGGDTLQELMASGEYIILFFSAIFLFYTNSFLIRRRKKEFGLYHILGMGKKNLGRILLWETIFTALISITVGLAGGVVLSKLAELGLINLMKEDVDYTMSVSLNGILTTAASFALIFLLLFLNSLRQIWFSGAISLLKSESAGEKPPKANWFLGILGVLVLAGAYYLAATIEDPYTAILVFMAAVLMVIAATYLIMIAGSVLFCRILQKKKSYYYKPVHFVSVSSMAWRMKRNGAGLASVCILATMVLVMISTTSAMFLGVEDTVQNRFPRDINLAVVRHKNQDISQEDIGLFSDVIDQVLERHGAEKSRVMSYRTSAVSGFLREGTVYLDSELPDGVDFGISDNHQIYLIPLEDYNNLNGRDVSLAEDEVLVYGYRMDYDSDTFGFAGKTQYRVKEHLKESFLIPDMAMDRMPPLMVVVPDLSTASEGLVNSEGKNMTVKKWNYCFDCSADDTEDIEIKEELKTAIGNLDSDGVRDWGYTLDCQPQERQDSYNLFGGLFYLGIFLSIVFLFAAVLIIYYKQISEGYEDQARFEIMQKVGMTKRDIRKTINSQILTVFFLPLLMAGLHLAFAFPIVEKLLLLGGLNNHRLFLGTTLGCFLVFAVFYVIVYRLTSNAYYQIVSGAKGRE